MDSNRRLNKIFDDSGLNLSDFSIRINESKSKVSHVLSGRNKPSLEFLQSVIKGFPHLDKLWVLTGEFQTEKIVERVKEVSILDQPQMDEPIKIQRKKLVSIVKFFDDGSFEEYSL